MACFSHFVDNISAHVSFPVGMQKLVSFFWFCSGADTELLKKCRTETSRYTGIGATIFFTGVFAFLAAAYALYSVFDNVIAATLFGIVWGLMIFNLDRLIVSSMRKEGRMGRELAMVAPRIVLAVLISIVIARPLELRIFEKEIEPELIVMEQEKYREQEEGLMLRYTPYQDSLRARINVLKLEVDAKAARRDELVRIAQAEADGTGGSRRRNPGPIYRLKKADADQAERELVALRSQHEPRIREMEVLLNESLGAMNAERSALERSPLDGPAARMEALSRIISESEAILWAHWFILLLFIAVETAPVIVKLISPRGPYDYLLRLAEHGFLVQETEGTARTNAEAKARSQDLPEQEKAFIDKRLNAELRG